MRRLGVIDRVRYLASKFHLLSGLIGNSNTFKGAQRELNQIEVYRANLLALDVYRREPLDGRLRALEIFETTRPGRVNVRDRIDWRALWNGPIKNHKVPGKNSGDMLSGENARVLGALLAQRLRLALHGHNYSEPLSQQLCQHAGILPALHTNRDAQQALFTALADYSNYPMSGKVQFRVPVRPFRPDAECCFSER